MKVKAYRDVMKHVSALIDSVEKKRRFVTAMAVPSKTAAKGAEGAITIADGDSESDDGDACPPDFEEPAAAHPAAGTSLRLDRADAEGERNQRARRQLHGATNGDGRPCTTE